MVLTLALVACSPQAPGPTPQPQTAAPLGPPAPASVPLGSPLASPRSVPTVASPSPVASPPAVVSPSASVSASASASLPPAPTAGPTNTTAAGGVQWQPLTDFPASDAFQVTSVTTVGDGFMAVGFGAMPGAGYFGRRQGVVWRSADGRTWTAESDPAFQFVTPQEVVALADSLYVFGTIAICDSLFSEECVEPPGSGWAVWRSTAGSAWERLPQLPQMQFGSVDGVAVTDTSIVAFGSTGDEARAVVWTSADGAAWTEATSLGELSQVTAAASTGTGVVVFGHSDATESLELVAATAPDGVQFAPAAAPRLADTTVRAVARGADGRLVAVGETSDEDLRVTAVALESPDGGATWNLAAAPDGSFADAGASFIYATANGYVALGSAPIPEEFGLTTGESWLSSDGIEWRTVGPFGGSFTDLGASASSVPGIVAFTVTSEETDDETVTSTIGAWFRPH